jgi:Zn-dependent M28 family amino/carboxypeptidase
MIPMAKPISAFLLTTVILCAGCVASKQQSKRSTPQAPTGLAAKLRAHVQNLAGERNVYQPEKLENAAAEIEEQFRAMGFQVQRRPVNIDPVFFLTRTNQTYNLEVTLQGASQPNKSIVIGAHYDTRVHMDGVHSKWPPGPGRGGTPGANDNASGVAALLEIARQFAGKPQARTIRFVAFCNEEPPFWQRQNDVMGSLVYARSLKESNVQVETMISLETMGRYSIDPEFDHPWYAKLVRLPRKPNYVAFLSNLSSHSTSRNWARVFASNSSITARTLGVPAVVDKVGWSDDWAFWQTGVRAFAVTDTAYLRSDAYHTDADTPEKLDFASFAEVVWALTKTVEIMANR